MKVRDRRELQVVISVLPLVHCTSIQRLGPLDIVSKSVLAGDVSAGTYPSWSFADGPRLRFFVVSGRTPEQPVRHPVRSSHAAPRILSSAVCGICSQAMFTTLPISAFNFNLLQSHLTAPKASFGPNVACSRTASASSVATPFSQLLPSQTGRWWTLPGLLRATVY